MLLILHPDTDESSEEYRLTLEHLRQLNSSASHSTRLTSHTATRSPATMPLRLNQAAI